MSREQINKINAVLAAYFDKHRGEIVPAKDLMPEFVKAGVFQQDITNGLPIRQLLRDLDSRDRLNLIPYIRPERKNFNTKWFFSDMPAPVEKQKTYREESPRAALRKSPVKPQQIKKRDRDEDYVINLCDVILEQTAKRQHRFDFLLGDTGAKLPVDAYYPVLNLVIEYRERQHTESVKFWNRLTASGIPRDEQRARYDQRRREVLPQHGIRLVEISYSDFKYDGHKRLLRLAEDDKKVVLNILKANNVL